MLSDLRVSLMLMLLMTQNINSKNGRAQPHVLTNIVKKDIIMYQF